MLPRAYEGTPTSAPTLRHLAIAATPVGIDAATHRPTLSVSCQLLLRRNTRDSSFGDARIRFPTHHRGRGLYGATDHFHALVKAVAPWGKRMPS